jgi:hypothetical protein
MWPYHVFTILNQLRSDILISEVLTSSKTRSNFAKIAECGGRGGIPPL